MTTSLIRKKSTVTNKTNYYTNKINYWLSPHEGDIPAFDQNWVPVGSIVAYTMSNSPVGWLICDGSEVYRNNYRGLFNVIGTTFGSGDGTTTFNLPDYRGAFLRGTGTHNGYSGPTLNTYQTDTLLTHNHTATSTVTDPGHVHTQGSINDDFNNTGSYGGVYTTPSFAQQDGSGTKTWSNVNNNTTGITVGTTVDASGNSTETRPYNYGVYWIIKY